LFAKAYQQAVFSAPKRAGVRGGGFSLFCSELTSVAILMFLSKIIKYFLCYSKKVRRVCKKSTKIDPPGPLKLSHPSSGFLI